MRRAVLALLLLTLVLAACGSGSSSTGSSSASASADPAEAAWAKEVEAVLTNFENKVSAQAVEAINTTSAQQLLEPLYATYGLHLARLAAELEATKAPPACVAVRKKIAADGRRVAQLNKELGEQEDLPQEKFSFLVEEQGAKIRKAGSAFTSLTAELAC
jgi:hypothetical protein